MGNIENAKKALLVYNPLSGRKGASNKIDHISGCFLNNGVSVQAFCIYDIFKEEFLNILNNEDVSFIIISGGDGTINAVVNIMIKNNIRLPIGIIPTGTCNDFARCLSIPKNLDTCIDIILCGKTTEVDVGMINDEKYFINSCAGGVLIDVSFMTSAKLKNKMGPLAYYLEAVKKITNIKPFSIDLTINNKKTDYDVLMFIILNGKHAAGLNNIAEEADMADGLMDIILINNMRYIEMISTVSNYLTKGTLNHKKITSFKANSCVIEASDSIPLTLDGEEWPNLPITVKMAKKLISVFVK